MARAQWGPCAHDKHTHNWPRNPRTPLPCPPQQVYLEQEHRGQWKVQVCNIHPVSLYKAVIDILSCICYLPLGGVVFPTAAAYIMWSWVFGVARITQTRQPGSTKEKWKSFSENKHEWGQLSNSWVYEIVRNVTPPIYMTKKWVCFSVFYSTTTFAKMQPSQNGLKIHITLLIFLMFSPGRGGDGVVRELLFRRPLTLSILTERRVFAPYGLEGQLRNLSCKLSYWLWYDAYTYTCC